MRNRLLMLFVQELRTPLLTIIAPLKELQKDDAQTSQLSYRWRTGTHSAWWMPATSCWQYTGRAIWNQNWKLLRIRWIK